MSTRRQAAHLGDRPGELKLKRMLKRAASSSSSTASASTSASGKWHSHHHSHHHSHKKARGADSSTDDAASSASSSGAGRKVSSPDARAKAVELLERALVGSVAASPSPAKPGKKDAGEEEKKTGGGKGKDKAGGKPAAAAAAGVGAEAASEVSQAKAHEVAAAVEEALHAKWTEGGSGGHHTHGYNDALRHLLYGLKRNADVRGKVLSGEITPSALLAMGPDDFLSATEKEDALRKGRHATFLSAAHTFSAVLFEQQQAAAEGKEEAAAQCKTCGSTKVLFGRRQTYNESSTWCGEEEGVPVMLNCLACGAVESQRD